MNIHGQLPATLARSGQNRFIDYCRNPSNYPISRVSSAQRGYFQILRPEWE